MKPSRIVNGIIEVIAINIPCKEVAWLNELRGIVKQAGKKLPKIWARNCQVSNMLPTLYERTFGS